MVGPFKDLNALVLFLLFLDKILVVSYSFLALLYLLCIFVSTCEKNRLCLSQQCKNQTAPSIFYSRSTGWILLKNIKIVLCKPHILKNFLSFDTYSFGFIDIQILIDFLMIR